MDWVKATLRFLHAWRHPDELAREVETELRFHVEMRARANIEEGMTPNEAQRAARDSFGDFDKVKSRCCDISRSLPFDLNPLRMGMYIAIATVAGGAALWAVKMPHHDFTAVLWQLVAIAVLARAFVVGRRSISTERFASDGTRRVFMNAGHKFRKRKVVAMDPGVGSTASHDEQGRTPVERVFNSE